MPIKFTVLALFPFKSEWLLKWWCYRWAMKQYFHIFDSLDPFYMYALIGIMERISNVMGCSIWDVVTHTCPRSSGIFIKQLKVKVMNWLSNYTLLCYADVIIHPCPDLEFGLANPSYQNRSIITRSHKTELHGVWCCLECSNLFWDLLGACQIAKRYADMDMLHQIA